MNGVESTQGSNVGKIIGCGCAVIALIAILGIGGCFAAFYWGMKKNQPYIDAIQTVTTHPDAIDALGEPIKPGFMISGSISIKNDTGEADFTIPVSGPEGAGKVRIVGKKAGGAWTYETFELQVEGQDEPIPLGQ